MSNTVLQLLECYKMPIEKYRKIPKCHTYHLFIHLTNVKRQLMILILKVGDLSCCYCKMSSTVSVAGREVDKWLH